MRRMNGMPIPQTCFIFILVSAARPPSVTEQNESVHLLGL